MQTLRAHADLIATHFGLHPGTVGRIMRATHGVIGLVLHDFQPVTFDGFGTYSCDDEKAVVFTPTEQLRAALVDGGPQPDYTTSSALLSAISDDAQEPSDVCATILTAWHRLIIDLILDGATVNYYGFGKYTPQPTIGIDFTPGTTLIAAVDSGNAPPAIPPGHHVNRRDDMARITDQHKE